MKKDTPCALCHLSPGCRARVARVEGSEAERSRLNALGLTPQAYIEVLDCSSGKQLVKVRGCNLVLDESLTCHITCSLEQVSQDNQG